VSAFADFYTGLHARIGEAWPDVGSAAGGGGVFFVEMRERIPFDDATALPFAVVHVPNWTNGDWGIANDAYEPTVEIYRVQAGPEDTVGVLEKLVTLKDYLRAHPLGTGFQLLPERSLSTSPFVSPVARMLSKLLAAAAGRLVVRYMFALKSL
jgi:hypothetical protein